MKIIRLTESQLKRLVESEMAPNFNGGTVKEYPGSEVSTTTTVTDSDGNPKFGKPRNTDRALADTLTPQCGWWNRNGGSGYRVAP